MSERSRDIRARAVEAGRAADPIAEGLQGLSVLNLRHDEETAAAIARIAGEITRSLKGKYGGYEIPKKFLFLTENFTLENGMLTQTMKLKRRVVLTKYMDQIEALYK